MMLTDLSISIAAKLARVKGQKFPDFVLTMTRVDLVKDRSGYLVRTKLAETEKEQFNSLGKEKRRLEWMAGRIAGKEAVFQLVDHDMRGIVLPHRDYQAVAIEKEAGGRPVVLMASEDHRRICLSISHSYGLAVAMASDVPCGVDIQKIDAALDRVRDYFIGSGEDELVDGIPDSLYAPREKLGLLWSAKEALKKQVGRSPMPGFRELELVEVGELYGMMVFTFALPPDKTGGQRFGRVAVAIYGRHTLAWTMGV